MSMETLTIGGVQQWMLAGGDWRLIEIAPDHATVDLCACTSEPMQRLSSEDPTVIAWIRTAPHRDGDVGC